MITTTTIDSTSPITYGIELHKHRFAAWAAGRAASATLTNRFEVQQGRAMLEECGFTADFARPDQLPEPHAIDEEHRRWRNEVMASARTRDLPFTHGVAVKLINRWVLS